jgi:hypothetical protein
MVTHRLVPTGKPKRGFAAGKISGSVSVHASYKRSSRGNCVELQSTRRNSGSDIAASQDRRNYPNQ